MTNDDVEIVACPPELTEEALALALRDIAVEQRADIVQPVLRSAESSNVPVEGLVIALRGGELCGAAWGQRQPGNTAIFWPPQTGAGADRDIAAPLTRIVVHKLDAIGVRMTQVLLPERDAAAASVLKANGFRHLADLRYLSWEVSAVPDGSGPGRRPGSIATLEFESYDESQRVRMMKLVEKTYEGTQDCAAMNGQRPLDEVLEGYRATGEFRPANWLFVRAEGRDVGVLLLADHRDAQHWELMYMGLVPEARGRRWGSAIVRRAQQLATQAGAERIVLAVDAANAPALRMYGDAGFVAWDERTVFVRVAE